MQAAVHAALPADAAIMVAAVADWRAEENGQKIKKKGEAPPPLKLIENPDILAGLARDPQRPRLLIGFAAETEQVLDHAQAKLARKGCDWIVANDVSGDVMRSEENKSALQSLMRISYAVFCLKKKKVNKFILVLIYGYNTVDQPSSLH